MKLYKSKLTIQLSILGLVLFHASGCVIHTPPAPNDPNFAPVLAPTGAAPVATNGSLFRANYGVNLFSDQKARGVGDILTVYLQEATSSTKSANLSVAKESETLFPEVDGAAGTILGNTFGVNTNLSGEREFSGEAGADQSNNLRGTIAVSVVDIWPNGALVIRGEKWMTLNRGEEFIRLSGVVRAQDVGSDNTVQSSRIANARISYAGKGALADSQTMGWLNRFFNSAYWPF